MDKPLVNKVAASGLITIDLENYFPETPVKSIDLKDFLFRELILREKDFRAALKEKDWTEYQDVNLAVFCSTDAIVPVWAYMLIASYAQPYVTSLFFGNPDAFYEDYYKKTIEQLEIEDYRDQRLVIKGCSNKPVPAAAYMYLTQKLRPLARSIMYGEPCSTVPIYKKPKK